MAAKGTRGVTYLRIGDEHTWFLGTSRKGLYALTTVKDDGFHCNAERLSDREEAFWFVVTFLEKRGVGLE